MVRLAESNQMPVFTDIEEMRTYIKVVWFPFPTIQNEDMGTLKYLTKDFSFEKMVDFKKYLNTYGKNPLKND